MRSYLFYAAALLVAASIFIGCNSAKNAQTTAAQKSPSTAGADTTYADGARRVTTAELAEMMKSNGAFVVDVRDQASFDAGHIPGARLIPAGQILNHVNELPKDKLIVTYCS